MRLRSTTNLDVLVLLGSIGLTEVVLWFAMELRRTLPFGRMLEQGSDYLPGLLFPIVGVIWFVMLMAFGVPRLVRVGHLIEGLWRLVSAVGLASLVCAGTLYLSFRAVSRLYFIYFVVLDLVVLVLFYGVMRLIVRQGGQSPETRGRVLIAGAEGIGMRIAFALQARHNGTSPVVGFLTLEPRGPGAQVGDMPVLGVVDDAPALVQQHAVDEIILALPLEDHPRTVGLVRRLQGMPVFIRLVPDFLDFAVMRASVDYLGGLPVVGLRVPAISEESRIAKRLFDMLVSALLLLLLSPVLLVIGLLVRLDSAGPVLYRAERVGENGRLFRMYKFRTMVQDADRRWQEVVARRADGRLVFKQPDDPRITRMGRWLRRTSLDELPQLFNVLCGDMSLVGPRPELPLVVREEYEPWQWSRFTVPQGMTGWWQVNRRGYEDLHLCTADDLYYIQNYSLLLDLQILLRTIYVVVTGQGAY